MKRPYRLLFLLGCVIAAGLLISNSSLVSVEAQKLVRVPGKGQTKSLQTNSLAQPGAASLAPWIVINEVDSDTDGTDAAEFVELKTNPNTSLNGYVLVFFNGSSNVSYRAISLDGATSDANGLVVVGNAAVPGVDIVFVDGGLQNGADAVALYAGNAASFPNGTAVTTADLLDAVVYNNGQTDGAGLHVLLRPEGASVEVNENSGGQGTTASAQRCTSAIRDGRAYTVATATPKAENSCATVQKAKVDYNGDGLSDFVINRPNFSGANASAFAEQRRSSLGGRRQAMTRQMKTGSAANIDSTPWEWWGAYNGAPSTPDHFATVFGYISDFPVVADFDGDGASDIAVWRPDEPSAFLSLNSSDLTFRYVEMGWPGDDPSVVGDYDGDGIDDPAVFRCPFDEAGQCYFFYKGSVDNPTGDLVWWEPWGFGTFFDVVPYPGDFNGDGIDDFCIEYINNPPQAVFWLRFNRAEGHEVVQWGLTDDLIVPGDVDGDGRSDFTVLRVEDDGRYSFWTLHRDGTHRYQSWGIAPDDVVPGDYDGDGRIDFAVYRWWNEKPAFWIQPANGDTHRMFLWGNPEDYPIARWQVQ